MTLSDDCRAINSCYLEKRVKERLEDLKYGASLPILGVVLAGTVAYIYKGPSTIVAHSSAELISSLEEASNELPLFLIAATIAALAISILMQILRYQLDQKKGQRILEELSGGCKFAASQCVGNSVNSIIAERAREFVKDKRFTDTISATTKTASDRLGA